MSQSLSRAGLVRKDAPELRDLTAKIRALREHDKEMKELKKQLNRERQRKWREKRLTVLSVASLGESGGAERKVNG
jgi:hypothetical protein